MKAALIIMTLFDTNPTVVVEFPTIEACVAAAQVQLLKKPPGDQTIISCGMLMQPGIQGEESIDPPAEKPKPKGESVD